MTDKGNLLSKIFLLGTHIELAKNIRLNDNRLPWEETKMVQRTRYGDVQLANARLVSVVYGWPNGSVDWQILCGVLWTRIRVFIVVFNFTLRIGHAIQTPLSWRDSFFFCCCWRCFHPFTPLWSSSRQSPLYVYCSVVFSKLHITPFQPPSLPTSRYIVQGNIYSVLCSRYNAVAFLVELNFLIHTIVFFFIVFISSSVHSVPFACVSVFVPHTYPHIIHKCV